MKQVSNKNFLLKISGEFLHQSQNSTLITILNQIKEATQKNYNLAVVIGGGNIMRGSEDPNKSNTFLPRIDRDKIGILSTLINSIYLKNALQNAKLSCSILSAVGIKNIFQEYSLEKACEALSKDKIFICAAGIGVPYVSTDTAAVIRALELQCQCVLKATKIDGIYDEDPKINVNAKFLSSISYDLFLKKNLKIMDSSSISIARDNKIGIKVFSPKISSILDVIMSKGKHSIIN